MGWRRIITLALALARAALSSEWDVHTPTNVTCLGGCACKPRCDPSFVLWYFRNGSAHRRLAACVPTAPSKDMKVFAQSLASLARHAVDIEAIYVISRASPAVEAAIAAVNAAGYRGRPDTFVTWVDEDAGHFPFTYASIKADLERRAGASHGGSYQYAVGWYLQQLLKLYCGRAVARMGTGPWSAEDVAAVPDRDALVVDSDVVFLRDVAFARASEVLDGRCAPTYAYAFSRESHGLYYETNARLLGKEAGKPVNDGAGRDLSGVVHHMALRGDVVAAIERTVAANFGGAPLYEALFADGAGVVKEAHRNAFSEYQLYFHFARRHFPQSAHVRQLYWGNGPGPRTVVACGAADAWPSDAQRGAKSDTDARDVDAAAGYDYVAYHSYAKRRPCVYGPAAGRSDGGVCFGGGCTYSCFKRRDDEKYKLRDRANQAPRLCGAAALAPVE